MMSKKEVFFRVVINPFVLHEAQSEPFQSVTEYKTRKEAKADAEAAAFAPNEYKIVICERVVI
jgi:hypothetical protein